MLTQSDWFPGAEEGVSCILSDSDGNEIYVLTVFPAYTNDEWRWHIDGEFPEYVDARTNGKERAMELAVKTANVMYTLV